MSVLKAVTPDTASEKSKELLTSTEKRLGGTSNMLRIMANSPAMLGAYLQFNHAFDEGKMTPKLRALITAAVAELNGGDYMLSTAMVLGPRLGVTVDELNRARQLQASDLRAAAALQFTGELLRNRGRVPAEKVEKLHALGFDDEEIVEIVAFITLNIFRNYLNLVAGTEIDLLAVKSNQTLQGRSAGQ